MRNSIKEKEVELPAAWDTTIKVYPFFSELSKKFLNENNSEIADNFLDEKNNSVLSVDDKSDLLLYISRVVNGGAAADRALTRFEDIDKSKAIDESKAIYKALLDPIDSRIETLKSQYRNHIIQYIKEDDFESFLNEEEKKQIERKAKLKTD